MAPEVINDLPLIPVKTTMGPTPSATHDLVFQLCDTHLIIFHSFAAAHFIVCPLHSCVIFLTFVVMDDDGRRETDEDGLRGFLRG